MTTTIEVAKAPYGYAYDNFLEFANSNFDSTPIQLFLVFKDSSSIDGCQDGYCGARLSLSVVDPPETDAQVNVGATFTLSASGKQSDNGVPSACDGCAVIPDPLFQTQDSFQAPSADQSTASIVALDASGHPFATLGLTPGQSAAPTAVINDLFGSNNYAPTESAAVYNGPHVTADKVGSVSEGHKVHIVCTVTGDAVTNSDDQTTAVWDKIDDPEGYVSDAYIYTGSDAAVGPSC